MKLKTIATAAVLAGTASAMTPASAEVINLGGRQLGSLLVYPLFQLSSTGYRSIIRIANNATTSQPNGGEVTVHLVRVCGAEVSFDREGFCDASNREITLTHNETRVVNVQNFFGITNATCETRTGYVVAYAVDPNNSSAPIEWNWLSGSTYQRRTNAIAFPNATAGAQAVSFEGDPTGQVAENTQLEDANGDPVAGGAFPILPFDGVAYRQLPTVWHSDFIATTNAVNPANGRRSALSVAMLNIKAGFDNDSSVVAIDWYNEAEDIFSTSFEYVCHSYRELQDISASFELGNLGSFYGAIYVTPDGTDSIIAQMKEVEPNRETLRNMFHDEAARATSFQGR